MSVTDTRLNVSILDQLSESMATIAVYSKWCSKAEFDCFVNSFQPALFRGSPMNDDYIDCFLDHTCDEFIDVSILNCEGVYLGHPNERACIEMSYSEFMRSFITKETLPDLFLSQCSLLNTNKQRAQINLSEEILHWLPPFLSAADIDQANLWANIAPACTSLHYDAYHNVLYVLQGSKTVRLMSPAMTAQLHPHCAFAEAPNHSSASWNSLDQYFTQEATMTTNCFEVTILAGAALFIPEGWWHTVQSTERTLAVNFWFEDRPMHTLLDDQRRHMLPYFLRSVVYESFVNQQQEANEKDSKRAKGADDKCADNSKVLLQRILQSSSSSGHTFSDRSLLIDELVSQSKTLDLFQQTWLPATKKSAVDMKAVVMLFSPQHAARLLRHWDNISEKYPNESKVVFREFYSYFGDQSEVIYKHLMTLQGQHLEQVGRQQLSLILGIS